ncbi:hypothetical protein GCM10022379_44500 [Micromonospora maritima]
MQQGREDRNGYEDHPGHPLHGVPLSVLSPARACLAEAAKYGDVDAHLAEELADAVVMAVLPAMRGWLDSPE